MATMFYRALRQKEYDPDNPTHMFRDRRGGSAGYPIQHITIDDGEKPPRRIFRRWGKCSAAWKQSRRMATRRERLKRADRFIRHPVVAPVVAGIILLLLAGLWHNLS